MPVWCPCGMWHTLRAPQGPRTAHVRPPYAIRTAPVAVCAVRGAGINTSFFSYVCSGSVSLTARSPYGPPAGALRLPCVCLGICQNLRPPQGRPKATVRYHFKGRKAAAGFLSPQIQNTPCGYPNICDCYSMRPWECCGGPMGAFV